MKKKTILAVVLAAAICATPLVGCDSEDPAGKPFEIENYATELTESMTASSRYGEVPAFTTMQTISMRLSSLSGNPEMAVEAGTEENQGKYRLYSLKKEASASDWYASISSYNNSPYLVFESEEDGSYERFYQIAWPTGELLFKDTFESLYDFSYDYGSYYPGSGGSVRWYGLTYSPDDGEEQTFYTAYVDGAWKKLTEKDINGEVEDYKVGDTLGIVKTPLANPETYPDYIYKDYSYVSEGSSYSYKYTFYKGNDELDSVTVFNNAVCGVVGHYFYYYDEAPVSADAKSGYNVEITSNYGTSQKVNAVLHRYDFLSGKDETVDTNYFFSPINGGVLYNKKTNDFDRILVRAYKETDGVAVVAQNFSREYTFILDEEAHVSFDMTAKSVSAPFYQLSDNRFLTGRTIVDKELNTVVQLPNSSFSVWEEQSLIITSGRTGYIAIDYDGKVAITGMGSISGVSGSNLLAYNQTGETAVFSKASPEGKTMSEITGDKENTPHYSNGLLYTITEDETTSDDTYTFYNLSGKKLGEFVGSLNSYGSGSISYEGKCFFSARDEKGGYVTLLFK